MGLFACLMRKQAGCCNAMTQLWRSCISFMPRVEQRQCQHLPPPLLTFKVSSPGRSAGRKWASFTHRQAQIATLLALFTAL